MKKIKSFTDVQYIIENKLDVVDTQGNMIPFVRFLSLSLVTIYNDVFGKWSYDTQS